MFTARPLETAVPSTETIPAMPEEAGMKPDPARSRLATVRLASKGVAITSAGLRGPALPSSFSEPPPATSASSENGKDDAAEKSRSSMLTFSSANGLAAPLFIVSRPLEILTSFTERSVAFALDVLVPAGLASAGRGGSRGVTPQARKIPLAGSGLEQRDLRLVYRQGSDVELARNNQRPQLHAHRQRLGAQERFLAKRRIVRDGDVAGRRTAGEQGKAGGRRSSLRVPERR